MEPVERLCHADTLTDKPHVEGVDVRAPRADNRLGTLQQVEALQRGVCKQLRKALSPGPSRCFRLYGPIRPAIPFYVFWIR
jgi:hypothetical protein